MPDGFSPRLVEREWIRGRGVTEDEMRLNLTLRLEDAVDEHESQLVARRQALAAAAVTRAMKILVWILQLD